MNIHHLELFYYVARFRGIAEAVRNIPYGIQQPAVSGQILQLEEYLGLTLFHRRPFALSSAGEELYQFIKPFFENISAVEARLRGTSHHILIGASEIILRDHLPPVLQIVRGKFPNLKVTLRSGYQPELESWLQQRELDLAVTLLEAKAPSGIQTLPLLQLPLVLLVPKSSKLRSAEELWKRDRIAEPLICLPASDAICKNFQQGLFRLGVAWFPGIEVSSFDLIEAYVANGYGVGLSVAVPKGKLSSKVRALPLTEFPAVTLGALWQGKTSPVTQAFLDAMKARAQSFAT